MAADLQGRRVAILAADGVERVELEQPREALDRAGARTEVLSVGEGEIQARDNDLDPAGTFSVDGLVAEASVADYDALVLPGGTVNPDKLRVEQDAVAFVRDFVESGKPVAAICHGPWTLIEAGVVTGRTLTSFPSIRTDLRNAGADVVDQDVVVDKNLITSRSPDDLSAFCDAIVSQIEGTSVQEETQEEVSS
ncbi:MULTISPECIES: type 1 glutamine amidotransferase domain-containing protein [Mycobacteriaceae]|uniref:Type 1 glutamine amidotransferase n=1 Tax=Mycolicibacterium parafortuitum TaxID=39692 RepID=A0ACC6MPW1_MYCPF|nr:MULTISPECIES: type 1 glutamine amidotransferase domain-containing protein [Mycobacteriaceae]MDZ5089055.1 type 1 glutamine amidotransferase [Mycolicibacterium parafortuitum]GFM21425.1 protease I [Mycobacterium sp. PO1]GFM26586.1 protease I [Mycobacterium sp. PO2]